MYEVTVSGWFAAAHQLRLADGGMESLHGHNWNVRVTLRGPRLDSTGLLVDFTKAQPRLAKFLEAMHDTNLNELPAFAEWNPTAENVARRVGEAMSEGWPEGVRVSTVEVEESPGCVARWIAERE